MGQSISAQLKIIKFKNDFYVEYNINYLQGNYFFREKDGINIDKLDDIFVHDSLT